MMVQLSPSSLQRPGSYLWFCWRFFVLKEKQPDHTTSPPRGAPSPLSASKPLLRSVWRSRSWPPARFELLANFKDVDHFSIQMYSFSQNPVQATMCQQPVARAPVSSWEGLLCTQPPASPPADDVILSFALWIFLVTMHLFPPIKSYRYYPGEKQALRIENKMK